MFNRAGDGENPEQLPADHAARSALLTNFVALCGGNVTFISNQAANELTLDEMRNLVHFCLPNAGSSQCYLLHTVYLHIMTKRSNHQPVLWPHSNAAISPATQDAIVTRFEHYAAAAGD
jgi:hypothetical protein